MKDSDKMTAIKCSHKFDKKMFNGVMCSKCGTSVTNKSGCVGLKSSQFCSKLHFDVSTVDKLFDQHRDTLRITNTMYIKARSSLVNFLFEKGGLLKISKKAIHCACIIMDNYFEKKQKPEIPSKDLNLVASCCLL